MLDISSILAEHQSTISGLEPLIPQIEMVAERMLACLQSGGKVLWMGNGGSAADSLAQFSVVYPEVAVPRVAASLVEHLADENGYVRSMVVKALEQVAATNPECVTPEVIDALVERLGDEDWNVRAGTAEALGQMGTANPEVVDTLVRMLRHENLDARIRAVDALGKVAVRIQGEVPLGDTGETGQRVFLGRGADTDILVASTQAYLFALNRLLAAQQAGQRQEGLTEAVRKTLEEMHATYGTAHTGDFMGWRALRDEDLI